MTNDINEQFIRDFDYSLEDPAPSTQAQKSENGSSETSDESVTSNYTENIPRNYPNFLEEAETVSGAILPDITENRRLINSTAEWSEDMLMDAVGEELLIYDLGKLARNRKRYMPTLKMRLSNGAAIYVVQPDLGSNWRHPSNFVGRKLKVAPKEFIETEELDDFGDHKYIVLGSIQSAEFIVLGSLYSEFINAQDRAKENGVEPEPIIHEGTVTQIIDRPAPTDANGAPIRGRNNRSYNRISRVFISYKGVPIAMEGQNFHYESIMHPLSADARIGQKVKFVVTGVEKTRYEDDRQREGNDAGPRGDRYRIFVSRLPFLKKPEDTVREYLDNQSTFIARIVKYHPVKGILVEIAPRWWIKGYLRMDSDIKPSFLDEKRHTPVTVRLSSIDFKEQNGRCYILGFPEGVAQNNLPND